MSSPQHDFHPDSPAARTARSRSYFWGTLIAIFACLLVLALMLVQWRARTLKETAHQRTILRRLVAAMAMPMAYELPKPTGLEDRYRFALEVVATEERTTPPELSKRLATFGQSKWSNVSATGEDAIWTALSHGLLATAGSEAEKLADTETADPLQRQRAQILAGQFLTGRGDLNEAARRFEAAEKLADRTKDPFPWANARSFLGEVRRRQTRLGDARQLWEESLRERENIAGEDAPTLLRWVMGMGFLVSDADEAFSYYRRAMEMQARQPSLTPMEVFYLRLIASNTLLGRHRFAEAETWARRAVEAGEALHSDIVKPGLAQAYLNAGEAITRLGRATEGETMLKRGLALMQEKGGSPQSDPLEYLLSVAKAKLGTGETGGAESAARQALAMLPAPPTNKGLQLENHLLEILGSVLRSTGRENEVETIYRRQLAISEQTDGKDSEQVAAVLNNLAVLLRHQQRYTEAVRLLQRALNIQDQHLSPADPRRSVGLSNLGILVAYTGQLAEGETLLLRAIALQAKETNGPSMQQAVNWNNLAEILGKQGRWKESGEDYLKAISIVAEVAKRAGRRPPEAKDLIENYTGALMAQGLSRSEASAQATAAAEKIFRDAGAPSL